MSYSGPFATRHFYEEMFHSTLICKILVHIVFQFDLHFSAQDLKFVGDMSLYKLSTEYLCGVSASERF